MKTIILCFTILCMWRFPVSAEPSVKETVDQYLEMLKQSKDARKPVVYPELAGRFEGLFLRYPVTHIVVNGLSEGAAKIVTDIYVKGEEFYVIQADEGWNLAANSAGVFEWEKGKKTGIKIKRSNDDLVNYLYYLTDPSWIMAGLYYEYLTSPDAFTAVDDKRNKWTELRLNSPRYGMEAIYVSKDPLWFHGLRVKEKETGKTREMAIFGPREMKELPEDITQ